MRLRRRHHRTTAVVVMTAALAVLATGCGDADETTASDADGSTTSEPSDAGSPEPAGVGAAGDEQAGTGASVATDQRGTATGTEAEAAEDAEELYPDVLGVVAELGPDGTWTFSATLSSPYDSPQRYADAWRLLGPDGEVLGIRELAHDHASEQPFTRSQSGIVVPDGVTTVTVQGRDQVSGWGGATVEVELER